jgi:hypothetical protein
MELSTLNTSIAANDGVEIELKHPSHGGGLGAYITVLGQDSNVYRRKLMERIERARKRSDVGSIWDESLELAVELTTAWRGIELDGISLVFNYENARKLYTDYSWIREQVTEAVQDRGNFLPRPNGKSVIT